MEKKYQKIRKCTPTILAVSKITQKHQNVTKGNQLVLILDLYQAKHMFSADANSLWKVVCLNVYVQGTIWTANAHCAYFVIVKF